MKPIKINEDLEAFAKEFSHNLFDGSNSKYVKRITRLEALLDDFEEPDHKKIIRFIIKHYANKKLLYSKPNVHQRLVDFVDNKFKNVFYNYETNSQLPFGTAVEEALRYDELQKKDAIKITKHLKLNTCPYCNASLTVTKKNEENEEKPRYQLDHFFPKSKYPFLSISFFNLIPSCSQCNQIKSNITLRLGDHFHLYSDKTPNNAFVFKLDKKSLIEYLIKEGNGSLKFEFKHNHVNHESLAEDHNKLFGIQGLYDTQVDVIEELVWKSQYYSKSRMEEIGVLLGISKESVSRMIFGNYMDFEDIHKRPLAKFTQDIARDLKLIK